jgi:hypothetical protein
MLPPLIVVQIVKMYGVLVINEIDECVAEIVRKQQKKNTHQFQKNTGGKSSF